MTLHMPSREIASKRKLDCTAWLLTIVWQSERHSDLIRLTHCKISLTMEAEEPMPFASKMDFVSFASTSSGTDTLTAGQRTTFWSSAACLQTHASSYMCTQQYRFCHATVPVH